MLIMTRLLRRFSLAELLKARLEKQDSKYMGIRFDSENVSPNELPQQMKKDNNGWEYVNAPPDGSRKS